MPQERQGLVIVIHGLFMNRLIMQPFTDRLHYLGWQTETFAYNSLNIELEEIYQRLDNLLSNAHDMPVHLVGHSLGGLIIRYYLHQHRPRGVSSVVTLGTPHQRTSSAERLQQLGMGWLIGNSGSHGLLESDLPDHWDVPIPLGTIAGTTAVGMRPLLFWQLDQEPSDGLVLVREACLPGETDHIDVSATHTNMIYTWDVIHQVDHFMQYQRFDHEAEDAQAAVNE